MGALQFVLAYLITMSVASERLVAIIKTVWPSLSEERKKPSQEVDLEKDRPRRLGVQGLAILSSWITVSLGATATTEAFDFHAFNPLGLVAIGDLKLPALLLIVLTSGGSALWNNVMGYTKAVKDPKQVEKDKETLNFHKQAKALGGPARDAGETAGVNPPR